MLDSRHSLFVRINGLRLNGSLGRMASRLSENLWKKCKSALLPPLLTTDLMRFGFLCRAVREGR